MKETTQMDKLRQAFTAGRQLTAKQISAQYRIASPHKVISNLRNKEGLAIKGQEFVNSKGRTSLKYALSRNTRVAA